MNDTGPETIQHSNQLIEGLVLSVRELIPSASLRARIAHSRDASIYKTFRKKAVTGFTAGYYSEDGFTLSFELPGNQFAFIEIRREKIPLTRIEMRVLGRLPDALAGLLVSPSSRGLELAQRISGRLAFEHLLLAKFLRGGHASTYWTPALVLHELQELTFKRYEGNPCTSGFVFTSKPTLYIPQLSETPYKFIAFPEPITVTSNYFRKPASFRYVDGRNSFYLIDNWQRVHGILAALTPAKFNIIDRCSHMHINPLVEKMPGRVWAAYVGNNDDVNVHRSGGVHLQWTKNHWHLRDKSILQTILEQQACSPQLIVPLMSTIFTLSDLRLGAVLLLLDKEDRLPDIAGVIDNSELGIALRRSFLDRSFNDLVETHSIIGLLSSDGLTTMNKEGKIIGCGDIINIESATATSMAGGGRTHAAIAASQYGLAIKISEDGPISIFRNKEELISL